MRSGLRINYKIAAIAGSICLHLLVLRPVSHAISSSASAFHLSPHNIFAAYFVPTSDQQITNCHQFSQCFQTTLDSKLIKKNIVVEESSIPAISASIPRSLSKNFGFAPVYYFQRIELTHPPVALTNPNIVLPAEDDVRIIGSVLLRVFISELGLVDGIEVEQRSLPESYVTAVVLGHKDIRFKAAELNGIQVKSQIQIEISLSTDENDFILGRVND